MTSASLECVQVSVVGTNSAILSNTTTGAPSESSIPVVAIAVPVAVVGGVGGVAVFVVVIIFWRKKKRRSGEEKGRG